MTLHIYKSAIAIIAVLAALSANAQHLTKDMDTAAYYHVHKGHYITLQGGYGMQTIKHKLPQAVGSTENGKGISLKLGYRWYFVPHLAIGTGIHYQHLESASMLDFSDTLRSASGTSYDNMGFPITSIARFSNWREEVSADLISVPLSLHWQTNLSNRWKLGLGAGVMMNVYSGNSYIATDGVIKPSAYYEQYYLDFDGDVDYLSEVSGPSGEYKLKTELQAMGELEIIYSITPKLDITLSGYATHGLTGLSNCDKYIYDTDLWLADWQSNSPQYNGVLDSRNTSNVNAVSVGAMLGVRYRIAHKDIEFSQMEQARRRKETKDYDMGIYRKHNYDKKKHKYTDDEADTTELAMEERRRREIQRLEMERKLRERDSLRSIAEAEAARKAEEARKKEEDKRYTKIEDDFSKYVTAINEKTKFEFNKYEINDPEIAKSIDKLADIMKKNKDLKFTIYGHTDNIGTEEQNKIAGMRRAEAFKNELQKRGVPEGQIKCVTKWFSEPLVPNTSEANRAKNRRIEIKR